MNAQEGIVSENPYALNWKQSSAHIWFLQTFLKPRQPDDFFNDTDWQQALGEPPAHAIHRFLKLVVLTEAPLPVRMDAQFSRDELRQMCREHEPRLSSSGNKDELISRLIANDWKGMEATTQIEMFQCSDYGRELAEKYRNDPQSVLCQAVEAAAKAETKTERDSGKKEAGLSPEEIRRTLRWMLAEGVVLGVVGNAAYDLLKELKEATIDWVKEEQPFSRELKPTTLAPGIKLEWCYVPAGEFLMGSADSDREAHNDEKPQHRVYVDAFYLGKYPITNEQYRVFAQKTGHREPDHWKDGFPREKANHPVVNVYWSDAVAFCEWAARATGVPIRLLTEAEWEKGARGTDGRIYPWGNTWQPAYCNTEESGIKGTTPVDRSPRGCSPYGTYDMIGNVWEWTSTIYKPYPYNASDGREDMNASGNRVWRGGSYWLSKAFARAACRIRYLVDWIRRRRFSCGGGGSFLFPL